MSEKRNLPPDVQETDLKYPGFENAVSYQELENLGINTNTLTFYETKGIGWVLTTLHISNPSRRQSSGTTARTYGIGVTDKKVYTVGKGPHVVQEVTLYINKDNLERMKKYIELWKKGMEQAGSIRDRISSRRAQGQLYRQAGRSHWNW